MRLKKRVEKLEQAQSVNGWKYKDINLSKLLRIVEELESRINKNETEK